MRHNPEAFELLVDRSIHRDSVRISWRSRAFGVDRSLEISDTWSRRGRGLDPRQIADYIERLVGNTLHQWFELRVQNGHEMALALMPMWEQEIYRFMERMEREAEYRTLDRHHLDNAYLAVNPRRMYYGWDMAFDPVEDPKAKQKARELLIRNLDAGQEKSFKKDGEFRVTAKDGKAYTIKTARSFNVVGSDGAKYCGQLKDTPIEDQMLAQKLLLEHEPEKFFKNANVSPAPTGREIRYSMVDDPRQWSVTNWGTM